ncbi:EamA domain-containing protein [Chloropicon roscoffensis]|uniref:EamA domain-containing protein n=1 Tax=Chloropicon roscoffensis TaxID=1461544 RepID=A0AAX4P7K8_9CHLO
MSARSPGLASARRGFLANPAGHGALQVRQIAPKGRRRRIPRAGGSSGSRETLASLWAAKASAWSSGRPSRGVRAFGVKSDSEGPSLAEGAVVTSGSAGGSRLMMLLVAALWGSYVPCLKVLYNMAGPPSIATYTAVHLLLAWAFLKLCQVAFFKVTDESFEDGKGKPDWSDGAELAFWDTAAALLQTWGVTLTSAVHAGVIICLATGFVPILSWVMIGQRPKAVEVAGSTLALVGAVLLALDGTGAVAAGGDLIVNGNFLGDMITALAALFYAVAMVRIHQKTSLVGVSSTRLAVDKALFAALIGMLWALGEAGYQSLVGGGWHSTWEGCFSANQWLIILFIGIGPSALSNVLQFKALSNLKPSEGQVILSTVPVWAILFSLAVGGPVAMGGMALGGLALIGISSSLVLFAEVALGG